MANSKFHLDIYIMQESEQTYEMLSVFLCLYRLYRKFTQENNSNQ
jgi:hypothetical protein